MELLELVLELVKASLVASVWSAAAIQLLDGLVSHYKALDCSFWR